MYQPGERWLYHTGADILGVLIARASGQALGTFFQERIFAPLGMVDTGFSVPKDKLSRVPAAYWANAQTKALDQFDGMQDTQYAFPPAFPSGGGGLCSTVDDFHAFARMLVNRGEHAGRRILSARSVERMTSDHLTPQQKSVSGLFPGFFDNRGWGFGVSMVTKADSVSAVPGRYGWDGGFGTHWFNDPAQDLVAMVMTQRAIDETFPASLFDKTVYEALGE
jgi:CubicO group peptidase (beta-lactamase class C family)